MSAHIPERIDAKHDRVAAGLVSRPAAIPYHVRDMMDHAVAHLRSSPNSEADRVSRGVVTAVRPPYSQGRRTMALALLRRRYPTGGTDRSNHHALRCVHHGCVGPPRRPRSSVFTNHDVVMERAIYAHAGCHRQNERSYWRARRAADRLKFALMLIDEEEIDTMPWRIMRMLIATCQYPPQGRDRWCR